MASYINYKFGSKGEKMEKNQIQKHVGIIMDGNGRWAKQQGKPRIFGHKEGAERVIDIVRASKNIGIKYLTLYAFSTENWKRSVDEVKGLMLLFEQFLKGQKKLMLKENVSLRIVGRKDGVSDRLLKIIDETTDSIRFYNLGKNWQHRVEKIGFDNSYDPDKDLLIF